MLSITKYKENSLREQNSIHIYINTRETITPIKRRQTKEIKLIWKCQNWTVESKLSLRNCGL